MNNGYIFVYKKDGNEIVYGNDRFYVNKQDSYEFDIRQNWIFLFILLVLTEGSIWLSQYVESFFYTNRMATIFCILLSIYFSKKISDLLIERLKLGYRRQNLKRVRTDMIIDDDMIHSCQKKYISYIFKELGLLVLAAFLYSIFYFTFRMYGLIFGMLIMTSFCMLRSLSNYPIYRKFIDSYRMDHGIQNQQLDDEVNKAAKKKRNG
jgi:hypothetical protein